MDKKEYHVCDAITTGLAVFNIVIFYMMWQATPHVPITRCRDDIGFKAMATELATANARSERLQNQTDTCKRTLDAIARALNTGIIEMESPTRTKCTWHTECPPSESKCKPYLCVDGRCQERVRDCDATRPSGAYGTHFNAYCDKNTGLCRYPPKSEKWACNLTTGGCSKRPE
jgi:hypothetical protein